MQGHNIDRSVLDLLPHRFPFVLLDRVLTVEPGRWAAAIKNVTLDEPWVDANGKLSPVFLAEAMAEAAGLAASTGAPGHPAPAMLVKIDRFRCRPVAAGDRMLVLARVLRRFGASVATRTCVRVDRSFRGAAELVLHVPQSGSR